eukprot:403376460
MESNIRTTVKVTLNDDGQFNTTNPEKIFYIDQGTQLLIMIKNSSPLANECKFYTSCIANQDKEAQLKNVKPKSNILEQSHTQSDQVSLRSDNSQSDYIDPVMILPDSSLSYGKLVYRLDFQQTGSFFIQVEYYDELTESTLFTEPQQFLVEPIFKVQMNEGYKTLNTRQMSVQTVLSRSLGTIDNWDRFLYTQKQLGYNTIHLTPIQQYGVSQSLYSIKDHNRLDDIYFSPQDLKQELSSDEQLTQLKQQIAQMKQDQGWIFIMDLVLNHAARNSQWVADNPQVTYNLQNCPWLNAAHKLDSAILKFSHDYANCKISSCIRAPFIENEIDLQNLLKALKQEVIDKLFIHEYFEINIAETVKKLEQFMKDPLNIDPKTTYNQAIRQIIRQSLNFKTSEIDLVLRNMSGHGESRYGVTIDIEFIANLLIDEDLKKPKKQITEELISILTAINTNWETKISDYMEEVVKNIEQDVRYNKIQLRNIKITERNTLVTPYFSTLLNDEKTRALNSGYIPNQNPFEEYGGKEGWHHLRRAAISWGDSVKLRYGKSREECPFLWDYMAQYVRSMCEIFDGVRLDNCHNTPLHVADYMIKQARSVNPNLYVCAELFCDSKQSEIKYVQKLGINHLLRDLQWTNSCDEMAGFVYHNLGCEYFNQTTDIERLKINPKNIRSLIFDCNHDNPSYVDRYQKQPSVMLSHLLINGLSGDGIASTFGFDILVPKQPSVVSEKRPFPIINNQLNLQEVQTIKKSKVAKRQKQDYKQVVNFYYKQKSKKEQTVELIDGVFTIDIELSPGKYEYKYVINGGQQWSCESTQQMLDNGFGNMNNFIEVKNNIVIEDEVPDIVNDSLAYVRSVMNKIHEECNMYENTISMHHQRDDNLILITRHFDSHKNKLFKSKNYDGYFLISKCEYPYEKKTFTETAFVKLPGYFVDLEFCGYLEVKMENQYYVYDPKVVNGMKESKVKMFIKQLPSYVTIEEDPFNKGMQQLKIMSYQDIPPNFNILIKYKAYENESQKDDEDDY